MKNNVIDFKEFYNALKKDEETYGNSHAYILEHLENPATRINTYLDKLHDTLGTHMDRLNARIEDFEEELLEQGIEDPESHILIKSLNEQYFILDEINTQIGNFKLMEIDVKNIERIQKG